MFKWMVMKNDIKKIYSNLSGGKQILSDDYIISSKHFNSISVDRFTSELRKRGINWNGNDVSFSNLFTNNMIENELNTSPTIFKKSNFIDENLNANLEINQIGIDIQEIKELPDVIDYWEDDFYKTKFTSKEIAYCLIKENPKQSFTGLFSCKEAILKSNNGLTWNEISIDHTENGKPFFNGYQLSISHSGNYAVAIALKLNQINNLNIELPKENSIKSIPISTIPQYSKLINRKSKITLTLFLLIFGLLFFLIFYFFFH